jgi:predicted ATPase
MLLVLDNCEHVIEAATALAVDTLRGAPSVRVLATSRELLRTEGEHVHRLSPLESPPTARQLSAADRAMAEHMTDPGDVTVRTLADAAEFARTYVGPRLPHRCDRIVGRLEEISDEASARIAARAFRAWAKVEGLLAEAS